MKTNLPESITTTEEAKNFLSELHENGEAFHPEDSAHDIAWNLPAEQTPTHEECEQLDNLMSDIYMLEGNAGNHADPVFDPCEYLLELDEEQERINKLARPTEFDTNVHRNNLFLYAIQDSKFETIKKKQGAAIFNE